MREDQARIRVLLVDDHPTLRQTVRSILEAYSNIEVVGEANDGEEALTDVDHLQPAVVVMDIHMTKMDGITATSLIKERYPQVAVIGLSVEHENYQLYAMKKAGASEVLAKENAVSELSDAIQRAVDRPA
jgi:DNA-binding NarL/FixJ family response regulator